MAAHISLKSRSASHFCNMFTRFTFDQQNLEMTSNSTTALSERPAEQSGPYVYLSGVVER